ncbi:MAG: TldD/PmbA family protein [Bacteroidales bacterium]|nr:TldD/PmbA family protein [Bacteroidales bacterium]
MMDNALLTQEEIALARHCLEYARQQGAGKVRITLSKSLMNLIGLLSGEVDKTAHALDRSLQIQLFVEGKYGAFSSNKLEKEGLEAFISEAIDTVKMLEPDSFRELPAPERLCTKALTGRELDLYDPAYASLSAQKRKEIALASMAWNRLQGRQEGWKLIAEEGEYSDSVFDSLTLDSQGLYARHTETSFEIGYESTVEDAEGNHFSSYWWDAAPLLENLQWKNCAETACRRAVEQIGPRSVESGKYNVVVDSECASKLLTPVLNALGGFSLQQKNSFLVDSLGKRLFPENLTILDLPLTPGDTGCRLFDSEGVATREMPVIENGVVKTYFLNTYIAGKMQAEPTIEDVTRIKLLPVGDSKTREQLMAQVGDGILVTGFNGGNSNPATGNFSYGIEGFLFRNGRPVHPVREMLITGNFLSLWGNLIGTADDARPCLSKLIPTLAFRQVDVSA